MSIWAQVKDDLVTAVPPDGRTIVDIYATFTFAGSPVPDGTIIKFIAGKGSAPDESPSEEDLRASLTPVEGVEFIEDSAPIEPKFIRQANGALVLTSVATASLKPIGDVLKDNITVIAYSTFDKVGTAKRLAFGALELTVDKGGGVFAAAVEKYDPTADTWTAVKSMPTGRSGLFSETVSGKIYAMGGFNGNFSKVCEEYDPVADTWATKTPMVIARGFGSSVVISNEIYIIGGYNFDPGRATAVVEKYNPFTDTWTTLAPLPFPLAFSTAVVSGTDIWVFHGGMKFDDKDRPTILNSGVLRYDTVLDDWTIEDVIVTGSASTTLSSATAIGDFLLPVPSGANFSTNGFVTIDRGLATEETVRYKAFTDGAFVLADALTIAHSFGADVDKAIFPTSRLAANSYIDGTTVNIFNGSNGTTYNDDLETFDVSTNAYSTTIVVSGQARGRAGQAAIASTLYLVGGSSAKSDFLGAVQTVDTTTATFSGPTGFEKMNIFRTSFGCAAANDGSDKIYAIGGQGSGHEKGWVQMDVTTTPESIRADGRETASVAVEATDASGDPIPDGTIFRVRGLVFISKGKSNEVKAAVKAAEEAAAEATESETGAAELEERTPPPTISVLPVLFSSQEMTLLNGKAATVLLDRSEDFVNEVENLLNFVKGDEKVLSADTLKKDPEKFSNAELKVGEKRELYNVAIEVTVDDPNFFGQTDSESAAAEVPNTSLASGTFSFNPPSAKQGRSGSVSFYSDVASMPDIQRLTTETDVVTATEKIDQLKEEIPFGASPHYDALVTGARYRIVEPPSLPLLPPTNIMVSASDNENSGSANSAAEVAEEVNLVDGPRRFPVFITTVVVTDPVSLAARKARTDVADLELISSATGGQSFSLNDASYISFIIDRIKTSAPSSIGSGSITVRHDIEGAISTFNFVVGNMIAGNTAVLSARYSSDGYTFIDLGVQLEAAQQAGNVSSTFTLGTPVTATVVEYTVKLASKTFDSPILKSVSIQYIKPSIQYLFTYPQNVSGQITELAAVTNERLPSGASVEVGFVHGDSFEFSRDYVSLNQPGITERGTIFSILRDAPLINGVVFRDVLESQDFIIYKAKSGPWAQDAIVRIFVNEIETLPADFVPVPEDGTIVFKRRLSSTDKVGIEIQNQSNFRVGLKITNPTLATGVLDSFAFMYGESEALQGLKPNRPPSATNLFISPSPVVPGGPIEANYTFVDPDGDEEDTDQTQIIWFRNGVPVPELNNKKSVSNQDLLARRTDGSRDNLISRGQQWFFTVRPSDGIAFGPLAVSHTVFIANVPPSATKVILKSSNPDDPLKFTSKDTITIEFEFSDLDDDQSVSNIYTFYANGLQVKTGTSNTLSADEEDEQGNKILSAGKVIRGEVIPSDGSDFGDVVTSDVITIESSAPTVTDVSLLPTKPSAASTLLLSFKYVDLDKDPDQSRIAWFANDVRKTDFDNIKQIPRGNLKPGQKWYAIVTPYDGSVEGEPVKSNVVLVQD